MGHTVLSLSLRNNSVSSHLAVLAQKDFLSQGIETTLLDAQDFKDVPLFSEDNEP